MINKVKKAIEDFDMLHCGDKVLVGLSGGADSISLLHALYSLKRELNLEIFAAHINHGLRGKDALDDENFARETCEKLRIPIYVLRADIKKEALEKGMGIEECGRSVRYRFFKEISQKLGSKTATAHTLSDNLETLILNFTRGAGLNGMCGIKPVRNNIIRPLIYLTRQEIEDYCKENNLKFIIDKSNYDRCYSRNKIRLDVIPILKEINPSVEKSALRMISQFKDVDNYIENQAKKVLESSKLSDGYDVKNLLELDKAVLSRCISIIAGGNLENIHIDLVIESLNNGFGTVTLPGKRYIELSSGVIRLKKEQNKQVELWEYKINSTNILTYNKREFIIKSIDIMEYNILLDKNKEFELFALDYDLITENTVVRNRRSSDSFKIPKRGITKSLKKLFNEEKIPIYVRNNLPIIADEDKVLWIYGFGASEFAKINKDTKKVLSIFPKECYHDK